jgi:predicted acylesterase/phospholipase RssA
MKQENSIIKVEQRLDQTGSGPPDLHILIGPGGLRSILGGIGAFLAFDLSGVARRAATIGGVSGGIIPAVLMAAKVNRKKALRIAIQTDFQAKLSPQKSFLGRILDILRIYRYESTLPTRGSYGSEKLAEFMDELVPEWPAPFWGPAYTLAGTVIFDAAGAHKYAGNVRVKLADTPPSVGLAVCASIAIPGIINAVPYQDEHLYDGSLGDEGYLPINLLKRHFNALERKIVAFDVGDEDIKKNRILRLLWKFFSRGLRCIIDVDHPEQRSEVVLIQAHITGFHGLRFRLTTDEKWSSIAEGFLATVDKLFESNLADKMSQLKMCRVARTIRAFQKTAIKPGEFTRRMEAFLVKEGLY